MLCIARIDVNNFFAILGGLSTKMKYMRKLALHWKIIIGMILGVLFGFIAVQFDGGDKYVTYYIKPFGTIFINLLKLIAVPLIIVSLIKGISDLKDISKLSTMGGRTIGIYLMTTVFAVVIGLVLVNTIKPGKWMNKETMEKLRQDYAANADEQIAQAKTQEKRKEEVGPLLPLIELVPDNIFKSLSENKMMLQVIFFVIFMGIGMILIPPEKAKPVKDFFDGLNEVILKLIDLIMLTAPFGVFALLAALIADAPSVDIIFGLFGYSITLLAGLAFLIFVFYPLIVVNFTGRSYTSFFSGISPAQLVAFSTSSSAATLPVTMERVEEHLGVDKEVASFVLPIGATVNMDGTSCYQAVAAVFIAQAFGMELSLGAQIGIIVTATLASIGSAAVPSAGLVMLVIVLGQAGIPEAGLALIFAVDRPLDMCRTVVNITGDATVSMLVAKSVGKLGEPKVKEWDDHYHKKQ